MQPSQLSRKQRFTTGFTSGAAAGIVASVVMLVLSTTLGSISLPEVFGSSLTQVMPPPLFQFLHQLIGGDAKHYLFYVILVGQCLVFAVCGGLCSLLLGTTKLGATRTSDQLRWTDGLLLAALLWLLVGIGFLPLTGGGVFGMFLANGLLNSMASLAVVGIVFGVLFVSIYNQLIVREALKQDVAPVETVSEGSLSRRTILQRSAIALGIGVVGVLAWRFISGAGAVSSSTAKLVGQFKNKIIPPPVPNYGTIQLVANLSPEITSNDQYYIVSKNLFSDPVVNGSTWSLRIHGMVKQPYTLNYNELMALPRKQQYESMMCISNEVGGDYMSNAKWEGIPLVDLLQKAGVQAGASKVVLSATDDYSDSIHLSKALEPTTLVAVRMNDVTLPDGHGFPARLLVPGIYGMKHVKWITDIELVNTDFQGYWQTRGWSDAAPIRLTSRIDTPLTGAILTANKPTYIAGVAFSGNKGISEVDVSLDNGNTWQQAILKKPLSDLTWVLWELAWTPAKSVQTIIVRAIDMEGNVQDPTQADPLPDGSSGYHTISVSVQ
jgi:DMSO/TMAO reductase YedYZ molybdopterin-dependent catalytic subunit